MQAIHRSAVTLVIGGARSGKTRYAQQLGERVENVVFVATAHAGDEEMCTKITRHRKERPQHWHTVEESLDLGGTIERYGSGADLIVIDCLTLFAANLLAATEDFPADKSEPEIARHIDYLCRALRATPCSVVLVSNEVGSGVVPAYPLGRRYRELLGEINQKTAQLADEVVLMVAGLPLSLKSAPKAIAAEIRL